MKSRTNATIQTLINWLGKIYWLVIIILLLSGCGLRTPPIELAPNGEVVKNAIALQLE